MLPPFTLTNTERHSLLAKTRFVTQADAIAILKTQLEEDRSEDGSKRPIILIGEGFQNDEEYFLSKWKWDICTLHTAVFRIRSLGPFGGLGSILPKVDRDIGVTAT
jgi:hypothetical protein